MKSHKRLFAVVFTFIVLIFISVNLYLKSLSLQENGRPYRVEINRIALAIEQNGFENVNLSEYKYVKNIAIYGDNFYNAESDYAIREINGRLYRFDYTAENNSGSTHIIAIVNVVMLIMSALIFGILLFIRVKILRPFEQITELPYELSKGNLTMPIKESKSTFFGKFLWGIDLLRENMEEQKKRELSLQKEKKTLLLSLSHDIKTPLSAIKLYAKALSKNLYQDVQKQQEIAESINKKADEIENFVTQIITASREDFLSIEVNNDEFYLSDLVEKISAYYSEKLSLVKTKFVIGQYRNCLLFGDLDRSVEVLQNMIENALKYGDGKCIELLFPDNDEGVLVTVRNTGCTLEKSDLPHIFQSFWRGKNAGKTVGSGLGLFICRQITNKMNGEIFAEITGDVIDVTVVFRRY